MISIHFGNNREEWVLFHVAIFMRGSLLFSLVMKWETQIVATTMYHLACSNNKYWIVTHNTCGQENFWTIVPNVLVISAIFTTSVVNSVRGNTSDKLVLCCISYDLNIICDKIKETYLFRKNCSIFPTPSWNLDYRVPKAMVGFNYGDNTDNWTMNLHCKY